jgi:hypothetical protein
MGTREIIDHETGEMIEVEFRPAAPEMEESEFTKGLAQMAAQKHPTTFVVVPITDLENPWGHVPKGDDFVLLNTWQAGQGLIVSTGSEEKMKELRDEVVKSLVIPKPRVVKLSEEAIERFKAEGRWDEKAGKVKP